jgi:predicted ribosome quality control (RQC) complex YloA/Tae2 family protein
MKSELSSLDLYYLSKELSELENSKTDRIYHSKEESSKLILTFHVTGKGKHYLTVKLPALAYIGHEKDAQGTPTGLCMMLRKYLEGSMLRTIAQKDFERVIELVFERKNDGKTEKYRLIIELFSKGNIIFCDADYKILNLYDAQTWKDRTLQRNETYKFPQSKHGNVTELDEDAFTEIIKKSDRESLVKALAMEFSLGGVYAEELCMNADVDKTTPLKKIADYGPLYKSFKKLFKRQMKPNVNSFGIFPFELDLHKNTDKKYYERFTQAIADNLTISNEKETKEFNKQIDKLKNILQEQEDSLVQCEKDYEDNQATAELIYKKYQLIDEILNILKQARKKYSWKEIKEKIKSDKKYGQIITNINEKDSEITIEIDA